MVMLFRITCQVSLNFYLMRGVVVCCETFMSSTFDVFTLYTCILFKASSSSESIPYAHQTIIIEYHFIRVKCCLDISSGCLS